MGKSGPIIVRDDKSPKPILSDSVIGHACGLVVIVMPGAVAWHAFHIGNPNQGAAVICTSTVAVLSLASW